MFQISFPYTLITRDKGQGYNKKIMFNSVWQKNILIMFNSDKYFNRVHFVG